MSTVSIRSVQSRDFNVLMQMGREAFAEARYGRYPMHEGKVEGLVSRAIQDADGVFGALLVNEHEIMGGVLGLVADHFFADMRYATNLVLYIKPQYRGSLRHIKMLIGAFESEARHRGANEILIGATSDLNPRGATTLFFKLGYHPVGANLVKYIGE